MIVLKKTVNTLLFIKILIIYLDGVKLTTTSAEIENIYSKFMKEVKSENGYLMLESDNSIPDIRNSVLWTGIVPKSDESKESTELKEKVEKSNPEITIDSKTKNEILLDKLAVPNENKYTDIHEDEDLEKNLDYERDMIEYEQTKKRVSPIIANNNTIKSPNYNPVSFEESKDLNNIPQQPILINNNIKQSAPMTNFAINSQQSQNNSSMNNNNYYNTYLNPFVFQNPAFNMISGNNYSQPQVNSKMPINYTFSNYKTINLDHHYQNQRMTMLNNSLNSQKQPSILANNMPQRMTSQGVFLNPMNFRNPNNNTNIKPNLATLNVPHSNMYMPSVNTNLTNNMNSYGMNPSTNNISGMIGISNMGGLNSVSNMNTGINLGNVPMPNSISGYNIIRPPSNKDFRPPPPDSYTNLEPKRSNEEEKK